MVMVSPRLNPQATWEFEAEILVLHHPTTISPRYQAMGGSLTIWINVSAYRFAMFLFFLSCLFIYCVETIVYLVITRLSLSSTVHCGSIRQTATILSMNRDCLRTGDKASVHFRFIKTPEYLHCDQRLVFREGRTKAVGTITKVTHKRHGQVFGQNASRKSNVLTFKGRRFAYARHQNHSPIAFFSAPAVHQ